MKIADVVMYNTHTIIILGVILLDKHESAKKTMENGMEMFENFTDRWANSSEENKMSYMKSDDENFKILSDRISNTFMIGGFLVSGGNPTVAAVSYSLAKASSNITKKLYKRIEKTMDRHKDDSGLYETYGSLYRDVERHVHTNPVYGNTVSFSVGQNGQENPSAQAAVQLEDGYKSGVAMVVSDKYLHNGYLPKDSTIKDRKFQVLKQSEFRTANKAMSSDPEMRAQTYKGLSDEEVVARELHYQTSVGHVHDEVVSALGNINDDSYLDVTGAPYIYNEVERKLYPSTVRYSGDSLKELMSLAQLSSDRTNVVNGESVIDMVDIAYAHGHHMQNVREEKSKLTWPEIQVDEKHPEVFTEQRRFHQVRHVFKGFAKGIKSKLSEWKDKGSAFIQKLKPQINKADKDIDEALEYLEVDSSEVEVPQVDKEADERRRAMAMMQDYVQNSVRASKQVAAGNDKGTQFE